MNSFVVGLIIFFISTFKKLVISWSIKQFGTNFRFLQMGRIVAFSKWDELTLGTNCSFLEFGTNCRLGRIVAWDELSSNQSLFLSSVLRSHQCNSAGTAWMGHAYKRHRLIGTHTSVPAEIKQICCSTDIRDNGYSRQEHSVPGVPYKRLPL